jgi:hypothetical protein
MLRGERPCNTCEQVSSLQIDDLLRATSMTHSRSMRKVRGRSGCGCQWTCLQLESEHKAATCKSWQHTHEIIALVFNRTPKPYNGQVSAAPRKVTKTRPSDAAATKLWAMRDAHFMPPSSSLLPTALQKTFRPRVTCVVGPVTGTARTLEIRIMLDIAGGCGA